MNDPIVPVYPDNKQPYGKTTERQDLDTRNPVMTGSLYTRPTGALSVAAEVVNKEYVDQFRIAPIATIYLPYIVGNYYTDNFAVGGYSSRRYSTRRRGTLSLYYLGTETYNFDQLAVRVQASIASSVMLPAIYRMSESTLLPTALLYTWGSMSTAAIATVTLDIQPIALTGLVGLYLQSDGPTGGNLDIDASSAAIKHGSSAFGQSVDSLVNTVSPPVAVAYTITVTDGVVANQVPPASLFQYSHLDESQADGSGLFLRRAA